MSSDECKRQVVRLPLHQQVADLLRADIASGQLPPGQMLPSEHELSAIYGVSRQTVRQALDALSLAGLVCKHPSKGTVVRQVPPGNPATSEAVTIGVLAAHLRGVFILDVLAGIERTVSRAGCTLAIRIPEPGPAGERDAIDGLRTAGVRGVLVEPSPRSGTDARYYTNLWSSGLPLVFFDRYLEDCPVPYAVSDNIAGGRELGCHLLRLGHRRLVFLSPSEQPLTSIRDRLWGVRSSLTDSNLHDVAMDEIDIQDQTVTDRRTSLSRELRRITALPIGQRPTALLCGNDELAGDAVSILRSLGLTIPADMAVTGFDDLPYGAWVQPPLTTVHQDAPRMGDVAASLMLEMIHSGKRTSDSIKIPVELRIRASTVGSGCLPSSGRPHGATALPAGPG